MYNKLLNAKERPLISHSRENRGLLPPAHPPRPIQPHLSGSSRDKGHGGKGTQSVPVLGNFPVLNSVEIVIRRVAVSEAALGHDQYEITFPEL